MPTLPRSPYSSETHRQPAINVNLKPCDCARPGKYHGEYPHYDGCAAAPLLIPCPIQRSATFEVRLGGCGRFEHCTRGGAYEGDHDPACRARPIRVSCSISGKTWEESDVHDVEDAAAREATGIAGFNACRERWALVKALVLHQPFSVEWLLRGTACDLAATRDAVYSTLAAMARAEEELQGAWEKLPEPLRLATEFDPDAKRASEWALASYIERLIEQVGVLS